MSIQLKKFSLAKPMLLHLLTNEKQTQKHRIDFVNYCQDDDLLSNDIGQQQLSLIV